MNVMQQGIVALIRSCLTGEVLPLPEGFDLEEAYPQIVRHSILTMVYDGAVRCGLDKQLPVMKKLFQGYVKCLMQSEGQMRAIAEVCEALDKNGFDHLILKGGILKELYPKPELRLMGDADILIRKAQYEAICPVMEDLGFRNTAQGFYDYGWRSPALYVELHHCLSNPYNTDFNSYLGDGWPKARKVQNGEHGFEYSPEDHFIYLFVHFTKHYRDGGIGLKHAADLWVYRRANPDMDEAYIVDALKEMGLDVFHSNVQRMLSTWFEGGQGDDVTDMIAATVFYSGAFGTGEEISKAVALRAANKVGSEKNAKIWRTLKMLFPGKVVMQRRYPILKKNPALLPFLWPVRWTGALMFRQDNIKKQRRTIQEDTSAETIRKYRQALSFVGLNYTSKD